MTEVLTPDEEAASARAAEQARLRKARREAKIKAGAENRLNRITGLGGGVQRDAPSPAPAPTTATTTSDDADPEEVDISQHFYQPKTTPRVPPSFNASNSNSNIDDAQLRQMMLGTATPPPAMPGMQEDDPIMKMMMQLLNGGGGGGGGAENLFAAAAGGDRPSAGNNHTTTATGPQPTAAALPNRSASLWRLLHTLIALALGLYIAACTPFTGTKLSRDRAAAAAAGSALERESLLSITGDGGEVTKNFFWAFATAEALLLGSRFFVERGRSRLDAAFGGGGGNSSGVLGLVVGFLPAGIRGKVEIAMRYGEMLGTVRRDVLVCVFVLGVASWWRG
ncbi:hypothetical protein N658DRAFT_496340 [Parathielavia hyrcaniae]|uniref:Golgi to ER traffic protein 2 n=1 Tax=Parathielavia hyrcaniae TaxID=113614 RepID=A0AAN6T243_9PEZI|nr:hypothetical protein N658DRAFT_496340 [Parathielavia hyrcaniae]